jgi:hypothetical protein
MKSICLVLIGLFSATTFGYWTGTAGDGNFGTAGNWSENPIVPLTTGGAVATTMNAGSGTVTVNLNAATADTLVDGINANFLSTRASAGANLIFNADWGNGYTNGAMWAGQSIGAGGSVTVNHSAGTLSLQTAASYFGRASAAGSSFVYNVNGGKLSLREAYLSDRTDALGNSALKVNNAAFEVTGVRFASGAYGTGTQSLFEVTGTSSVFIKEWRNAASITVVPPVPYAAGESKVRIVGSHATVQFDDNFYARHDGNATGQAIVEFIADADGISTITAFDALAKLNLSASALAVLNVDLTAYTGTADLRLFSFTANNGLQFGTVNLIGNANAQLVYDFAGGSIYVTNLVPEPATLIMLGLGALGLIKRKRS